MNRKFSKRTKSGIRKHFPNIIYYKPKPQSPLDNLRVNNQITAPEMLVIDDAGVSLGVLKREEALQLAQEKGLDLIEVSPNTQPPVAKIMSFDKYRYQQEKKIKKQRAAQKNLGMKQVQISARAAKNDLEVKARKANEFLAEGHPVEIVLVLKGREKANRDWAFEKLKEFVHLISSDCKVISDPKFTMRGIIMQVMKS